MLAGSIISHSAGCFYHSLQQQTFSFQFRGANVTTLNLSYGHFQYIIQTNVVIHGSTFGKGP